MNLCRGVVPVFLAVVRSRLVFGSMLFAAGIMLATCSATAQNPTTTVISSNANPTTPTDSVTLTATVVPAPDGGRVTFTDNGSNLTCAGGNPATVASGTATCSTSFSTPGVHPLNASYSGDPNFTSSSTTVPLNEDVVATPTVTESPAHSTLTTAQPDQVTITVSGGNGNPTPTGSVMLSSGTYSSASTTLSSGSATIPIPAGRLAVGSDILTASYTPDSGSSSTYNSASGTAPVTVVQAIGTCSTSNPNPNLNPAVFAAVQDFNGDCKSDILWRNTTSGQVYEWQMSGTAISSSASVTTISSDWVIQGTGDFNGDGKSDIVWRNTTTGQVYIWLMNGSTIATSASPATISSDWVIRGIGDFDGDGKSDIAWRNSTTGQVNIWLMNGTAIKTSASPSTISSDWVIQGTGDFNGDGKSDIVWRNTTSGQVYIWLMNGTAIASSASPSTITTDWVISGVGDFNGDGMSDILWRNSTTGQVYIWLMNGTAIASSASPGTITTDWVIDGTGDYDGSGRSGILWRNTNSGQVYIWLMNGTTITTSASPNTISSDWQIFSQVATSEGGSAIIPQTAISVTNIQTLSSWIEAADTGSGSDGGAAGAMNLVSSPSYGGAQALQFLTSFTNSGDERYSTVFGDDPNAMNFVWDAWVYLDQSLTNIANLEMDMNQVLTNGQTVIYGFQCDGYSGTWDYTTNAGTPQSPVDKWVHATAPCNVRNWAPETWHHLQVQYSRDNSGNVTYQSVWLDGVQSQINATVPSAFALGWGQVLLTNFEVDGLGASGSSTVYLDNLTVYRW